LFKCIDMTCRKLLFLLFSLQSVFALHAQINEGGKVRNPYNGSQKITHYDFLYEQQKCNTLTAGPGNPRVAGYTEKVGFCLADLSNQIELVEGTAIMRVLFTSDIETGIAIYFSRLVISSETKVFVYSADGKTTLGSFGNDDREPGEFAIQPVFGGKVVLQVEWPEGSGVPDICVSEAGLVHEQFGTGDFGDSGYCEVNVHCAEGQEFANQQQGVARILVKKGSGLYWCTGSLVNNTRQDRTPYLLTANHCGSGASQADYSQWIFYFNYASPTCNNLTKEPEIQSISGSTLKAAAQQSDISTGSDFKLLQLNQEVPLSYKPYYNGWSRLNDVSQQGACVHHPEGDIKKISTFFSKPVSTAFGQVSPNPAQKYWMVTWAATANGHGVTEGGSSGSPLFNADGQIVGALTGGSSACNATLEPDYFGKFSYSWESNGSNDNQQLKPWLDPLNLDIESLNGIGSDPDNLFAEFAADYTEIVPGQTIAFTSYSGGNIISYNWIFGGGIPSESQNQHPAGIRYNAIGKYDVSLVVKNGITSDTLIRKSYINVMPYAVPNPAGKTFTIFTGAVDAQQFDVKMYDAMGRKLDFFRSTDNNSQIQIQLKAPVTGFFIVVMQSPEAVVRLKLVGGN